MHHSVVLCSPMHGHCHVPLGTGMWVFHFSAVCSLQTRESLPKAQVALVSSVQGSKTEAGAQQGPQRKQRDEPARVFLFRAFGVPDQSFLHPGDTHFMERC